MNTQLSLDISDELHCIINTQGEILGLNQKFAEVLYMRKDALSGKILYELLPEALQEGFKEQVDTLLLLKARNFQVELLNALKETVQVRGRMILDSEQQIHLSGTIFLSQEARLARFKRFFDLSLLEMVVSIGIDGKFTYFNRGFADILGFSFQEINHTSFFDMIDATQLTETMAHLEALRIHEGITRNFNNRCKQKNNNYRVISWRMTFNKDAYYAVGTDITEQEEQRLQNERLLKDLEMQNKEQKHTLQELETRNFELDQFVYKVSHDLRAPLTSIMGLINLSRLDGDSPEKVVNYINMMETSTQKLDRFITSLLEYSRSNREYQDVEKIDFEEIIENSLDGLKYIKGFEKMQIDIEVKKSDIAFFAEPMKLSIIFNNILSNAVKYQNKRISPNILKIEIDYTPDWYANIRIWDNGIGINQRYLDKVFNMFFRATETSEGSGLGLYIVKQAVERVGGAVQINSDYGKSTEVIMQIPNRNPDIM
ncbi:MAG: PAS domain-containing sensor histidine kinase [Bacteroidetes bacterium]|nr:MAG: PAS domain-containing sensor histidine kinase [Bacteroidota bacterium]